MALIAPLAGAAIGGLMTGGAGWAMSAGWLIGSWLMQDKDEQNTIIDPGAQELPRTNQALRGVTKPVLFGTNRVSSQIVWRKNFTTIRHESTQGGGGGKGGGSGMGAKGGGPSTTQVSYEYKIDLLMHLGMGDSDFSLFGGWLGPERLNGETLLAIINNSNSGFGGGLFRSQVDRPQNASLTFEEGFFHGNQATDDANAVNWDHFETEEGQPFRFPFTSYVGFKQLNLGGSAAIPQLSWEIGPGEIDLTFEPTFGDYYNSHSFSKTSSMGPSGGLIRGEDGKLYHFDLSAGNNMGKLRDITSGVDVDTYTDSEFDAAATALGLDPGSNYTFTSSIGSNTLPDQNLILMWGQDIGLGTRSNYAFIIYKVNSSGVLEAVGGAQLRANGSLNHVSGNAVTGVYGEQTDDDPILIMSTSQVSTSFTYHLLVVPSINQMKNIYISDSGTNEYNLRLVDLEASVSEILNKFGDHDSHRTYLQNSMGFFLPVVGIGLLGPEWTSKVFFYIGKGDIEWAIDNPGSASGSATIENLTGSHPNGGIFSVGINADNPIGPFVDASWTDEAANWIDATTENAVIPFADAGRRADETTIDDGSDYDPSPAVQKLTTGAGAGATLVTFFKSTDQTDTDRGTTGTFTQVQAFLWNPLEQIAKRYVKKSGSFADTATDWGFSGAYTQQGTSGYYDESTGELYISGGVDGGGASDDVFVSTIGTFNIGGGEDALPPFIIFKILTSEVFGFNIDASNIDQSSYELALLYCTSENIKCSVQYRREESKLNAINDLLALYGGFLIDSGGQIKFGLTTFAGGDYGSVVRTIDNDHLLVDGDEAPVRVTRGARQDTYNKVKVNYFDRDLEYRQNFVEISDEVDIDLHGTRAQEFPPKFVLTEATANKLAIRALWSNLYTRDTYSFKLGPKDADLEPGDVITLVDSFHPKLQSGKQVRLVQWIEDEPLKFSVTATDDVQYVSQETLQADSQQLATQNTLFGPSAPAADFTMYELPKEFQGANAQIYVGYRQQSAAKGAHLYTSADGVSFAQVQEVQPFILSGIISEPLPDRSVGYVDENITFYLMPDTATGNWSVGSDTWAQTFQLDDVGPSGRASGGGLFWINSEMLAIEGVNLIGQNHYMIDKVYRGWGGTHIQGHSSGDTWHKHGGGIFTQAYNEDKIGNIVHYKVAPFNFAGVEFDISSVDARTYQIKGTFFRPQNAAQLQTYVQSPGSFLTVQSEDLGIISKKNVIAGGSPVAFEWYETARARGYGARAYGLGGYGRFEQDTTSVQFRVEVLSNDLSTVVRCTTVSTTQFIYDTDANSTDWNAWNGDFAIKVTPFNEFGDALRTQVKTLELFE